MGRVARDGGEWARFLPPDRLSAQARIIEASRTEESFLRVKSGAMMNELDSRLRGNDGYSWLRRNFYAEME
jgi:hypothetical protein